MLGNVFSLLLLLLLPLLSSLFSPSLHLPARIVYEVFAIPGSPLSPVPVPASCSPSPQEEAEIENLFRRQPLCFVDGLEDSERYQILEKTLSLSLSLP